MADQEAPPDDESEQGGHDRAGRGGIIGSWPAPADPVGRQEAQAYGCKILLVLLQNTLIINSEQLTQTASKSFTEKSVSIRLSEVRPEFIIFS